MREIKFAKFTNQRKNERSGEFLKIGPRRGDRRNDVKFSRLENWHGNEHETEFRKFEPTV